MQHRNQFPLLLKALRYEIGVELGVFKGEFSKIVLSSWPGSLYLVDVWRELDSSVYEDASNHKFHAGILGEVVRNINGFEDRAFVMRMKGSQAVELFKDEGLDFVFIDANHRYSAVKEDISMWYPKVRKGGMLSGHDYLPREMYEKDDRKDLPIYMSDTGAYGGLFGVNSAVDEFALLCGLEVRVTEEFFGTWWVIK